MFKLIASLIPSTSVTVSATSLVVGPSSPAPPFLSTSMIAALRVAAIVRANHTFNSPNTLILLSSIASREIRKYPRCVLMSYANSKNGLTANSGFSANSSTTGSAATADCLTTGYLPVPFDTFLTVTNWSRLNSNSFSLRISVTISSGITTKPESVLILPPAMSRFSPCKYASNALTSSLVTSGTSILKSSFFKIDLSSISCTSSFSSDFSSSTSNSSSCFFNFSISSFLAFANSTSSFSSASNASARRVSIFSFNSSIT